jgi:hypothetical protein
MKRVLLVLILIACCSSVALSQTNESLNSAQEKNVICGVLFGGIGIAGIYIPGTFGWGNFYAEDYTGFWILNIGGSICTLCTWVEAIRLVNTIGVNFKPEDMSALAYVGVLGSIGFAVASIVMGGTSVDKYNYLLKDQKVSYLFIPKTDGLELGLTYRF